MTSTGGELGGAAPNQFPFEQAYRGNLAESMHFYGQLHTIIGDLAITHTAQHVTRHFWHPARLVRAAVDSKVGGEDRVDMLQLVTDYARAAYTDTPTHKEFTAVTESLAAHGLYPRWVEQTYDQTTLEAQQPGRAAAAAERLHVRVGDRNLLVLPLCHGGLLSAIEGAAYYTRMTGRDAAMYPVRYSRTKAFDREPKIRPEELDYLREAAQGRTVVVYDDDTKTGRTISRTVQYLAKNGIGAGGNLVGVVNYDRRSNRGMARQGQWFENLA